MLGLPALAAPLFPPVDHCEEFAKELVSEDPPDRVDRPPMANTVDVDTANNATVVSDWDKNFPTFKWHPPKLIVAI